MLRNCNGPLFDASGRLQPIEMDGEPCGNIHDVSLKTGLTCLCAELPYHKLRGWRFFCQCNCPCPSCDMRDETFCNKIRVCALVFQQRCDPIFYIVLVLLPYVVYACWYYLAPVFERLFTVSGPIP